MRQLSGLPPELLMVPLLGHTLGHAGVVIEGATSVSAHELAHRTLLYAADAYFYHAEMDLQRPHCTPGLAVYQTMMEKDRRLRIESQHNLRALRRKAGQELTVFCAHDVAEYEWLSGHSLGVQARPPALAGTRGQVATVGP